MFTVFLLLAVAASGPATAPAQDGPGFKLYCIQWAGKAPPRAEEAELREMACICDDSGKLIGTYRRGERIAKSFQDWRVVDLLNRPNRKPSMIVTNVETKETLELEMTADFRRVPRGPVQVQ